MKQAKHPCPSHLVLESGFSHDWLCLNCEQPLCICNASAHCFGAQQGPYVSQELQGLPGEDDGIRKRQAGDSEAVSLYSKRYVGHLLPMEFQQRE
jgi:hypothetical protein